MAIKLTTAKALIENLGYHRFAHGYDDIVLRWVLSWYDYMTF